MTVAPTTQEWWSFTPPGGPEVSLSQPWLSTTTIGGARLNIPTFRGNNYEVPFRNGMLYRQKWAGSRTITLLMQVNGIDPATGQPATSDQILAWNNNFAYIRQALYVVDPLGSNQGKLTRRWYITQNGIPAVVAASAMAEVGSDLAPTMTGRTRADFTADLVLADPYFYGATQTAVIAANSPVTLAPLGEAVVGSGFSSSVSTFTCLLTGPLHFPALFNQTAGSTGVQVTYGDVIASGSTVALDFLAYTAVTNTGISVLNKISHAGSNMWFCLTPSPVPGQAAANVVTLNTTDPTDTGSATLVWNDTYV